MAVIANTRVVTLVNPLSDPKALVQSRDALDLCTPGTDVIFDFLNPLSYQAEATPDNGAPLPTMCVIDAYASAAGSGGANGTYPIVFSGGGGAGAAGTLTVAGGSITAVNITARGAGYTSAPAVVLSGIAGLSGAAITVQMANVLNVAKDVQPALGRTRPVGVYPSAYATRPNYDGKGALFVNGTTPGILIEKGGMFRGNVFQPAAEGFLDFLEVVSVKSNGVPAAGRSPFAGGGASCGFNVSTTGQPTTLETGAVIGPAMADGVQYTLAKRVRFNVGADTSTIVGWTAFNGQITQSAVFTGKVPSSYATAYTANTAANIGSTSGSSGTAWNGRVFYFLRERLSVTGRSDAECAEFVKRIHDRVAARYA